VDKLFEQAVDLDFVFFATEEMRGHLEAAEFREIETYERDPYPEVEVQTRRGYIRARR
jgi:hypothetical protein